MSKTEERGDVGSGILVALPIIVVSESLRKIWLTSADVEGVKMTWLPANISATCRLNPSLTTCQPSLLSFMGFLVHLFGGSNDEPVKNFEAKNRAKSLTEYDFIIVGAGAAGCVLANRLSEISRWKVLLLEAGDEEPFITNVPGFGRLFDGSSIDWKFKSEPETYGCRDSPGNSCSLSRGKVMGGSSALIEETRTRDDQKNFDEWARLGNGGWNFKSVLPYFKKSENTVKGEFLPKDPIGSARGDNFIIDAFRHNDSNSDMIFDAWKDLGFKEVNFSGAKQIGVFRAQSINGRRFRLSVNEEFIRPIRSRRSNLYIKTRSTVTKILINPDNKKAFGVEYSPSDNRKIVRRVTAKKEVIVAAGAFNSPKLLMLSGIGHAQELKRANIKLIKDLPVGDNLQNHIHVVSSVAVLDKRASTIVNVLTMQNHTIEWFNTRGAGPLSSVGGPSSCVTSIRVSNASQSQVPDVEIHHSTSLLENVEASESYNGLPNYIPMVYYNAIGMTNILMNPKSQGFVRLDKKNPTWHQPSIKLNILANPDDVKSLVKSALIAKDLFRTETFRKRNVKKYTRPPNACGGHIFESEKYFECITRNYARPGNYFAGTCKMGPPCDKRSVVDPQLKVLGIQNLRVVDASIMPTITSGSTHAATIVIAEKGSDLIRKKWFNL